MVKDELISSEVKPHSLHLLQGIEATKKLFPTLREHKRGPGNEINVYSPAILSKHFFPALYRFLQEGAT